jgi:hypothetical protein
MKRPGVITLIGWVILLQAFFGAVAGVTTIALRSTDSVIEATGATASDLLIAGVWLLIVALVHCTRHSGWEPHRSWCGGLRSDHSRGRSCVLVVHEPSGRIRILRPDHRRCGRLRAVVPIQRKGRRVLRSRLGVDKPVPESTGA